MNDAIVEIVMLVTFVLMALWAVLATKLLRAVVALAATSVLVTLLLFRLGAAERTVQFVDRSDAGRMFPLFQPVKRLRADARPTSQLNL